MRTSKKLYKICPKCGKKGFSYNQSRWYAGFECRYCKHHITTYVHIYAGAWVKKSELDTPEKRVKISQEVRAYLEAHHYIDTEGRYRIPEEEKL